MSQRDSFHKHPFGFQKLEFYCSLKLDTYLTVSDRRAAFNTLAWKRFERLSDYTSCHFMHTSRLAHLAQMDFAESSVRKWQQSLCALKCDAKGPWPMWQVDSKNKLDK